MLLAWSTLVPELAGPDSVPLASYLRTNASAARRWYLAREGAVGGPGHVDARSVHGDVQGASSSGCRSGGAELAGPEFVAVGVVLAHEGILSRRLALVWPGKRAVVIPAT